MSKSWFLMVVLLLVALPSVRVCRRYGGGWVAWWGWSIRFKSRPRPSAKSFSAIGCTAPSCNMCHPKIFVKKNNSNHVIMKAMERGKSCGACHNGRKAFSVNGDCTNCHAGDIVFKEPDAGDVIFSHAVHVDMFGCDECHPELFKAERGANRATMEEMEAGKACGACHDGSAAFSVAEDCDSCHKS